MRIHAGKFKNHKIKRPNVETTKATSSMVREAVFNMVNPSDKVVLDLFAGSGSYGITAFSLGASFINFVDNNKVAYQTIKENINKLSISNNTLVSLSTYEKFLKINNTKFDLIFLDPPYNFNNYENLINELKNHLNAAGSIVLELNFRTNITLEAINLKVIKDKKYGIKRVIIFSNDLYL